MMCEFCEPWYNTKPLVNIESLIVRLKVKDDMNWYVQVFSRGIWTKKWREVYLDPVYGCPICGRAL